MKIQVNEAYTPLWQPKTRYILLTGGRASAKSFTVALWASDALTRHPGWRMLYTRYTMTAAEISIIPEFRDKIEVLGLSEDVDITARNIAHKQTGTDILFSGIKTSSGNQTARLKSIPKLNVFIVDETEEFTDESAFDTIDESIRREDAQNLVIILMNPQTTDHWVYRRWFEGYTQYRTIDGHQIPVSIHPAITHIHTTYLSNRQHLSADYLKKIELLKLEQPRKYAHRFLGQWLERSEGAVFQNWQEGEFDVSLPYAFGLDFGFFPDPLAMVKVAVDKGRKRIYVHECIYENNLSAYQVKTTVKEFSGIMPVICDTSEPRLLDEMQGYQINAQKAEKGADSVINGIRAMQDYQIIVTPESQNIKRELRLYAWNDKKHSVPIDDNNHGIDALRYCFTFLAAGSSFLSSL
jgi:phage terminase large subunit